MEFHTFLAEKEVRFEVPSSAADVIDQLAFIHLVRMKFNARETLAEVRTIGKLRHYIFTVRFPDFGACSDAQAHCGRNLSGTGQIVNDYRGALDHADPARMMARSMMERADKGSSESPG